MKRIALMLLLLGLCIPAVFEGCKKPEKDPVTPGNPVAGAEKDSTFFLTVYVGCNEADGKKGLALVYLRQDKLKGKYQPTEILGADYMRFSYTNYTEIFAALQIAHSAILRGDPVLEKYKTDSEYWEDMFKSKPGFVKRQTLSKAQATTLIDQKPFLLASQPIPPGPTYWTDYLASALMNMVPSVQAQNSGQSQAETGLGYLMIAVGGVVTVGAIAVSSPVLITVGGVLGGLTIAGFGLNLVQKDTEDAGKRADSQLNAALNGGRNPYGYGGNRPAAGSQGDPLISGLDGNYMLLHPAGEFLAIRSKNDEFNAQVRFEPVGTRPVSTTTSFAVRTGKDVVCFTVKPLTIHVNGQAVKTDFGTYLLQDKAYLTRPATNRYEVVTTWGDKIEVRVLPNFNISWYVRILNEKRKNQVDGLLGQFNDNPDDDFKDKAGNIYTVGKTSRADFYKKFVPDWRITQNESLLIYPPGKTTESYTKPDFPETQISLFDFDLSSRQKAEKTCRNAGITGEPDLSNCMIDVLATGMDEMAEQMGLAFKLKQESATYYQRLTDFPGKSSEGAVGLAVGDKIYAGLGKTQIDWAMYDPATDKWTAKTPFPGGKNAYARIGTFAIGNKIYCLGGVIDGTMTNALWEYDTQTDKWTRRKDLPGAARFNIASFAVNGKGYALFGTIGWGNVGDFPTNSAVYEYTPATDTWTQKADFSAKPRGNNITSQEYNGMVMVIDGRPFLGGGSGGGAPGNDWYEYIPARDAWEKRANIPIDGQEYFSVGTIGYLIWGNALLSYDASRDTWSKWPGKEIYKPLATNQIRGIKQAPVLNGRAYIGLGYQTSNVGNKEWWSFLP